jgi:hypothetical protein
LNRTLKAVLIAALAVPLAFAGELPPADMSVAGMTYVATLANGFTVRFDHRRVMQDTSRLYLSAAEDGYFDVPTGQIAGIEQEKVPSRTVPGPPGRPPDVRAAVAASDKNDLDPDLVDSVIRAESGFNPRAVSSKGAQGLMQLMPGTAAELGVPDAFDPRANVEGGTRYLRELLVRYHNDLAKALAAYNAGPERVEQYRGVPPYHETRAYVSRVIRDFNRRKLAQRAEEKARPAAASANRGNRAGNTGD